MKIGGLVAILAGLVLLGYGIYGSFRMNEARRDIESKTSYVPGDSVRGFFREGLYAEVDKYKLPVTLCYVGAFVCILGGSLMIYFARQK